MFFYFPWNWLFREPEVDHLWWYRLGHFLGEHSIARQHKPPPRREVQSIGNLPGRLRPHHDPTTLERSHSRVQQRSSMKPRGGVLRESTVGPPRSILHRILPSEG